jgi:hypothetical protein
VTLSVTAILQLRRPRLLRGMLPYGVRTFLQQALRPTSDHLPSGPNLSQSGTQERESPQITQISADFSKGVIQEPKKQSAEAAEALRWTRF